MRAVAGRKNDRFDRKKETLTIVDTMLNTSDLRVFNRIVLAALFLAFLIGCTKGYRLRSQTDAICEEKADQAVQRGNYELGIQLHLDFLKKQPENALARYHLGYAYGMLGDHKKEIDSYEKAVALGYEGDANFYYNLGMAYGELDLPQKAISAFKRALEIDPLNADIRVGLGLAYQSDVDFRSAEKEFKRAIEMMPRHIEARLHLAVLYSDTGELQKAREQLKIILDIDPDHALARKFLNSIEKE